MKLSQDEINLLEDLARRLEKDGFVLTAKALKKLLAMNIR